MKRIIGVMGPGNKAKKEDLINSYKIGEFCANNNLVTLTGGRNVGVMNEALKGAKENGGETIGILPSDDKDTFSEYLDIAIPTNMRGARNFINILSSDILVICGLEAGTSSEISYGISYNKKIILIGLYEEANIFFKKLGGENIFTVNNYNEAIKILKENI